MPLDNAWRDESEVIPFRLPASTTDTRQSSLFHQGAFQSLSVLEFDGGKHDDDSVIPILPMQQPPQLSLLIVVLEWESQ